MIDLLLRLYPARWRERYGDELRALVVDTGLSPRVALDLISAAARERQRSAALALAGGVTMTFGPASRHPTTAALLAAAVLAPTAVFVTGSLLAYGLGISAFIGTMESANAWLTSQPRFVDLLLVLAPAVALLVAVVPLVRLELTTGKDGEIVIGVRMRALNVIVGLLALIVGAFLVSHIVAESVLQAGA
jgi:hypothetical protein